MLNPLRHPVQFIGAGGARHPSAKGRPTGMLQGGSLMSISSKQFTQLIGRVTPACASGLVTSVSHKFGSGPSTVTSYAYDNLGRLAQAKEGGTARSSFAYNLNGCPTAISRFGVADREGGEAVYGDIDRAAFAYDGNQLVSSTDAAVYLSYAGANDLPNGESEYAYDANGNMALDTGRGIDTVAYSRLNLPVRIACADKSVITFEYDELGAKLAETDSIPVSFIIRPLGAFEPLPGIGGELPLKPLCNVTRTEYCGSCVYVGGKLKRLLFPGGYATPKAMGGGYNYHYYVTDYLGSVRAVVAEDGAVEEASSYYPYGMQMPDETGSIKQVQPYKYGGKERLTAAGVNLYDFGPRALYSPAAQFTSMDPMCEDYPHLTPYLYCAANPANFVDPTGMSLRLTGNETDVSEYLLMISNATGYQYEIDSEGYVHQGEKLSGKKKVSSTLNQVIKSAIDSSEEYGIEIVGDEKDEDVMIDSYENRQVDITDLRKVQKCNKAFLGAIIGHFINEIQVGNNYKTAHAQSLLVEGRIYGELVGDKSIYTRKDYATSYNCEDGNYYITYEYSPSHKYQFVTGVLNFDVTTESYSFFPNIPAMNAHFQNVQTINVNYNGLIKQ